MLGLEVAVANTVRRNCKVLVIANGVFGEGFSDLVKMYGGEPVVLSLDWRRSASPREVERVLEKNKDVEVVTLVHCDTPSAILNDLKSVSKVVRDFGPLLVVDAVSSIGGVEVAVDDCRVDILIGGSQKVLNAPASLTIITVSGEAWERIEKVGYKGFYMDLKLWRDMLDSKEVFPYTFCDPLLYALDEALEIIFEEGLSNAYKRHLLAREASWRALKALGLESYPSTISDSSPTVTAINVPAGINEGLLRKICWEKYGVMIGGSWGRLAGKVIRLGHMGVQASLSHLVLGYTALARALSEAGYKASVAEAVKAIEEVYGKFIG